MSLSGAVTRDAFGWLTAESFDGVGEEDPLPLNPRIPSVSPAGRVTEPFLDAIDRLLKRLNRRDTGAA